jgi:hypothetical protein
MSPLIIFTDGACEGDPKGGSVGGILMDAEGKEKSFFSERVPDDIMQRLLLKSKNPIFELELFPILLSALVWSKEMDNRPVIFYIDNEGAKAALVSASSSTQAGSEIIEAFVRKEFELSLKVWFARVPTASNPADPPSRLQCSELLSRGVSQVKCDWREASEALGWCQRG